MSPFVAEVVGTFLLLLLGDGVVANAVYRKSKGSGGGWIVITTGWGLAVFTGVVVAGPYSGAHLNPAVTIGLAAGGLFPWSEVLPYIVAQMLGAMLGAVSVWFMYGDHRKATDDLVMKRAAFYTYPEISNPIPNLLSEILGTFVLVFAIFYFTDAMIGDAETPIGMGSLGAIPVAFIVWVIGLSLGGPTGYAINPARDWGPRIIYNLFQAKKFRIKEDWNYSWIPIVGPVLGALVAAFLFFIFS